MLGTRDGYRAMTHEEVWAGEIASLRQQASRRDGWVVCTPDAYYAVMDFRRNYYAARRLDELNGTNHAARWSPDTLALGRVARSLEDLRTFGKDEAEALCGRMAWAAEFSDDGFIACTIGQMVERRAAAIVEEQQLEQGA
jgi:hypothetical protein